MGAISSLWKGVAIVCACGAVASMGISPLHAAEQVNLSNGSSLACNHHATVDGKVRLYTGPGNDDFVDLNPAEIASVEIVSDPPRLNSTSAATAAVTGTALTRADMQELISQAGAQHDLDADLLASVVRAESGGNARAVSPAGAQGLMQLMPGTAAQLGVADSFRPDQNINGGTAYLDALLTRYHENLAVALAAYNAGPAAVDKYHGVPPYPETQTYVARVIREFNRRKVAEMRSRNAVAKSGLSRPAE
jgi:hypothetical protein